MRFGLQQSFWRHAVLCATVIKLESLLTDAALSMFDKLMGSVARKASRRNDERTLQSAREVRARIAALTKACRGRGQYPDSVHGTFNLALNRVIAGDPDRGITAIPEAEQLMQVLAFLAPDQIPLDFSTLLHRYAISMEILTT
jgi:hypothetical protein